jgi:arabinan endo-1,5-alpha-L-arabinosidase
MKSTDFASRRNFLKQIAASAGLATVGVLRPESILSRPASGVSHAPRTYTNPVYAGNIPDPFVLRHRGVYYAFGTTGGERKADGRIFTVLRSTNLVDWREAGGALTPPTPDTD